MMQMLRDSLTGLPNLIALVDHLRYLPADPGFLVLLDLEHTATVNEMHGTLVGDKVIGAFGGALRDLTEDLREEARAFRTGGDEFLLQLPGIQPERLEEVLDQLGREFRSQLAAEGLPEMTFHRAAASYPGDGRSLALLLARLHEQIPTGARPSGRGGAGWVEAMLGWFVRRLAETIDELRLTREMAMTDRVSGMPNHRSAEQFIDDLLKRHNQTGEPFTLLFVDGDNLKSYNDRLGYEAGNLMIRRLGETLKEHLRAGDFISRWLSGDEFLVVLPNTTGEVGSRVAERLRTAVACESATWALDITVSVGVATCPEDGNTENGLIRAVTLANTKAKRMGKNQIHWPRQDKGDYPSSISGSSPTPN